MAPHCTIGGPNPLQLAVLLHDLKFPFLSSRHGWVVMCAVKLRASAAPPQWAWTVPLWACIAGTGYPMAQASTRSRQRWEEGLFGPMLLRWWQLCALKLCNLLNVASLQIPLPMFVFSRKLLSCGKPFGFSCTCLYSYFETSFLCLCFCLFIIFWHFLTCFKRWTRRKEESLCVCLVGWTEDRILRGNATKMQYYPWYQHYRFWFWIKRPKVWYFSCKRNHWEVELLVRSEHLGLFGSHLRSFLSNAGQQQLWFAGWLLCRLCQELWCGCVWCVEGDAWGICCEYSTVQNGVLFMNM